MMPLLTLGLPTSATAAIMLAAFQQYGLQPGPLLFQNSRDTGLGPDRQPVHRQSDVAGAEPAADPVVGASCSRSPDHCSYTGILVFATLGVWSLSNSVVDLVTMYLIGVVGYAMRRLDFPIGPAILGVVLGPRIEQEFRRALAISQGDVTTFFTRPVSVALLLIALAVLVAPYVPALGRARGQRFSIADNTE